MFMLTDCNFTENMISYTKEVNLMFEITLITVGKLKEKFYLSAAAEYEKRLKGYCRFQILELPESRLPEDPSPAEINAGLEKEADLIFSKVPKGAWLCIFTPEGKLLSSEDLAKKLMDVKLSGKSSACFLIGSSFGISQRVKEKADFRLSMSPMTFPHHLARIMVLEQLYRAEAIQAGSKYHK
jgi:23S rRNA (pseudouridine1915-N3)-methyltransferase